MHKHTCLLFCFFLVFFCCGSLAEEARKYNVGKTYSAGLDSGFSRNDPIGRDDPHYDWILGQFYVKGFQSVRSTGSTTIFYVSPGETVSVYFSLKQDIHKLNGKGNVEICEDNSAFDKWLHKKRVPFGSGALFILQDTGQESDVQSRLDFLATLTPKKARKVMECGAGGYTFHLDYKIQVRYGLFYMMSDVRDYQINFNMNVVELKNTAQVISCKTDEVVDGNMALTKGFYLKTFGPKPPNIKVKRQTVAREDGVYKVTTKTIGRGTEGEVYDEKGLYTVTVTDAKTKKELSVLRLSVKADAVQKSYFSEKVLGKTSGSSGSKGLPVETPAPTAVPTPTPSPSPTPFAVLRYDTRSDAVTELQQILYANNYLDKEPTGYFDGNTVKAVKDFQFMQNMKETGICDEETWNRLHEKKIPYNRVVYVSRNGLIHYDPECSGMKYYREMKISDALRKNYGYCSKCR